MNSNINNNNNSSELNMIDMISIMSFVTQLKNIDNDNVETDYIHNFIKEIRDEIRKLHEENDIIIEKLNYLLNKKEGGI